MVRSAVWYEGWVRPAIQAFKYEGEFARDRHLAELALPLLAEFGPNLLIAPVPLHPRRLKERGYNQSEKLALRISIATGLLITGALYREINTRHQVGLSGHERALNVRDAFLVEGTDVAGRRVLLIDDVMTTGATLGACASALEDAGATWVSAITVARER
jgi:ComF family protein